MKISRLGSAGLSLLTGKWRTASGVDSRASLGFLAAGVGLDPARPGFCHAGDP